MITSFVIGMFLGFSFGLVLAVLVWRERQAVIDRLVVALSKRQ